MSSPIHEFEGEWYFWDESEAYRIGGYESRAIAEEALKDYCKWLDSAEYLL